MHANTAETLATLERPSRAAPRHADLQALGHYFFRRGGVEALSQRFEKAGLGGLFRSWASQGAALPLTVDQLRRVYSEVELVQLAKDTDRNSRTLAVSLAETLPDLVKMLTRNNGPP
jgi:uncharacterized protein YidB (DUF937 family)